MPLRPLAIPLLAAACAQVLAPCARGQDVPSPEPEDTRRSVVEFLGSPKPWTLQIEPTLWYAALDGDVLVNAAPGDGRLNIRAVDLDEPSPQPAGEIHFRADRLTFTFSGFNVTAEEAGPTQQAFAWSGVGAGVGEVVDASISWTSIEALVGWRLWSWPAPENIDPEVTLALLAQGGARLHHFDMEFRTPTGLADAAEPFFEPVLGLRLEIELTAQFSIDLAVNVGWWPGGNEILSTSVLVGFQWRPVPNLGVQIGFRKLTADAEDGDTLQFDGSVTGLMGSIVVRF